MEVPLYIVRMILDMIPIKYKNVKEGLYEIDQDGNIYSHYKKDYLLPKKDKDGYLQLKLSGGSRNNKCYVRVATLVAWHYLGEPPKEMIDPTINHKDGNITNNYYLNLEWMERGKNSSIRENKGKAEQNHESKLTVQQVEEICNLLIKTNMPFKQIAEKYQVHDSTINNIKNKKNWKEITEKYDFSCRVRIRNEKGQFQTININCLMEGSSGLK
ncbi:MAG TPA: hypothetical protein VJZ51_06430 [Bacilli bacterium]|nr:hypothetical protein [Bacilli bacterium]